MKISSLSVQKFTTPLWLKRKRIPKLKDSEALRKGAKLKAD
jgi:hypothetical protein